MREKNPNNNKLKRLSITYAEGDLDSKKLQHMAYDLGFSSMSRLLIDIIQKFVIKHEIK